MKLKQLRLRKMIDLKKEKLNQINSDLEAINTRSQELETALNEAETEEDVTLVDEEVEKLSAEKEEKEKDKKTLEDEINSLENDLKESEENQEEVKTNPTPEVEERKEVIKMNLTRSQELKALVRNENVTRYLSNLKEAAKTRSVANVDLTIPTELFEIITDEIGKKSVMYSLVNVKKLTGKGRALIVAEAPKAIWVEQTDALKELNANISQIEVDGFKLGGFIPLHNSQIEDSVINLLELVVDLLSDAIAKSLDEAILFGNGSKKPVGIWGALVGKTTENAQTNPTIATQIVKAHTEKTLLADIVKGVAKLKKANGKRTVIMSESTWLNYIVASTINLNDAGQLVAAQSGKLPVLGYDVQFVEEFPDDMMIIGDFKKYLLSERTGLKVDTSTDVKFIEDQTLIKATQRFDGKPINNESFIIVTLKTSVTTNPVTFVE